MENNVIRSDLHLCNDHPQLSVSPPFHTSNQSNDESSIMATGDNLYLRPPSTYRFTATPEASATNSSSSNSSNTHPNPFAVTWEKDLFAMKYRKTCFTG